MEVVVVALTVAVTGASGFVGRHVAQALRQRKHRVVALGRTPVPGEFRRWDAACETPDLSGCDAVVHCAAAVGDTGRAQHFRVVNVEGASRLLGVVGERPVVWMSSSSVYSSRQRRHLADESHPTSEGHLGHYGRTKAMGETMALAQGAVVLRPTAVYGLDERHLVPRLRRLVRGHTLLLPGPDVQLSLTDVDGLARAAVQALAWAPGAYNIADPEPYSRDEVLISVLGQVTGRALRPLRLPRSPVKLIGPLLPGINRYSLDLITHEHTYDVRKALAAGWDAGEVRVQDLDWARTEPR